MKRFSTLATVILLFVIFNANAISIEELESKANKQDPVAQYSLAQAFFQGNGVPKDPQSAIVWLRNSAENGYPLAQLKLANAYDSGLAIEENRDKALYWYTKSATQGLARAQFKLGAIYERTYRNTKNILDLKTAEVWFRIALDNNSSQAEDAYNRILETQFNHRKSAQVVQFDQLDKAHKEQALSNQTAHRPLEKNLDWYLTHFHNQIVYGSVGFAVLLLFIVVLILFVKNRRIQSHYELDSKLSDQTQQIKKLARELAKAHKKILKQSGMLEELKSASKNQKFHVACAVFGFNPVRLPQKNVIKDRYKKLCRIYHPDMNGSDEEMRRLNTALKIILQQKVN